MLRGLLVLAPALVAGISFASTRYASAEDIKLPPTLTFTAYDTGTAGFNIAVGVGKMMKDKYSTDVRVLPAGNDVARLAPLRASAAKNGGRSRFRSCSRASIAIAVRLASQPIPA